MPFLLDLIKLPFLCLLEVFYFVFRCRPKKEIKGQHILITGAGQGIGAEFARQFADMGNIVHCVDIEEKLVNIVVEDLKSTGHKAYSYTCDLTKHEQVQKLYDDVAGAGFVINVLINNAGVAFARPLHEMTLTQIQHAMNVNIVSNLWLIKLFIPKMLELNEGHIVNIASLAGIFPLKHNTDYCAAKAGSIHALSQLRSDHIHTNLKFTAVCPFFVNTKMITGIKPPMTVSPEDLVTKAIRGIREDQEMVIVPNFFRVIKVIKDIAPSLLRSMAKNARSRGDINKFVGQRMSEKVQ